LELDPELPLFSLSLGKSGPFVVIMVLRGRNW
jgi:hypothetical protein